MMQKNKWKIRSAVAWALLAACGGWAQELPPQFQVWGSRAPDVVASLPLPAGVKEVLPPNADFGPKIVLQEQDVAKGFLPYTCAPFGFMHPQLRPSAAQRADPKMTGFAARGEYEPLAMGVYATTALTDMKVVVEPLLHKSGAVLPAECVDVRWVRFLPNLISPTQAVLQPLVLEKLLTNALPQNTSAFVWVTVYVPENTEAGVYKGALRLEAPNLPARRIPVIFRVFPFTLEKTERLFGMLYGFGWGKDWIRGNPENYRNEFVDMREHNMNHLAYSQQCPSFSGNPQDGFTFDFNVPAKGGTLPLGQVVDDAVRLGLDKAYFTHIHNPKAYSKSWICGYEWGTTEADQWYASLYRAWTAEAVKRRWPQIIHNIADEPQIRNGTLAVARHLAELVKRGDPSNRTSAFLMGNLCYGEDDIAAFGDTLDTYITFIGDGVYQRRLKESGHTYLLYNQANPNRPLECRQACGFTIANTGAAGHQQFCYRMLENTKKLDPVLACYDNLNPKASVIEPAWIYSYPGVDGLLPNPAFEGIREGVDDLRYWEMLQKLLDQAEQSGDEAVRAKARVQRKEFQDELAKFSPLTPEGNYRGSGWMYFSGQESYDALRYQMAKAIVSWKEGIAAAAGLCPTATPDSAAHKGARELADANSFVRNVEYASGDARRSWPATRKVAVMAVLPGAPSVDGELTDDCWTAAQEYGGDFTRLGGGEIPHEAQSFFRLGYFGDTVYLAARFLDAEAIRKYRKPGARPQQFVWNGDNVEIYLGDPGQPGVVQHLAVNLWADAAALTARYAPGRFAGDRPDARLDMVTLRTAVNESGWTLEAAMPASFWGRSKLPGAGAGWVCNLARTANNTGGPVLSSWSPTVVTFNEPWLFGAAFNSRVSPISLEWAERQPTDNGDLLICRLRNSGNSEWTGKVFATGKADGTMFEEQRDASIPPGVHPLFFRLPTTAEAMVIGCVDGGTSLELGGITQPRRTEKQFMPGVGQSQQPDMPEAVGVLQGRNAVASGEMYNLRFSLPVSQQALQLMPIEIQLQQQHKGEWREIGRQSVPLKHSEGELLLRLPGEHGQYRVHITFGELQVTQSVRIVSGVGD